MPRPINPSNPTKAHLRVTRNRAHVKIEERVPTSLGKFVTRGRMLLTKDEFAAIASHYDSKVKSNIHDEATEVSVRSAREEKIHERKR